MRGRSMESWDVVQECVNVEFNGGGGELRFGVESTLQFERRRGCASVRYWIAISSPRGRKPNELALYHWELAGKVRLSQHFLIRKTQRARDGSDEKLRPLWTRPPTTVFTSTPSDLTRRYVGLTTQSTQEGLHQIHPPSIPQAWSPRPYTRRCKFRKSGSPTGLTNHTGLKDNRRYRPVPTECTCLRRLEGRRLLAYLQAKIPILPRDTVSLSWHDRRVGKTNGSFRLLRPHSNKQALQDAAGRIPVFGLRCTMHKTVSKGRKA